MHSVPPHDKVLAALDTFENRAGVLGREREFLNRLRSDKDTVTQIGTAIQKHQKTADEALVIVKNAVCAFCVATTYWRLPDQLREQNEKCEKLKAALRVLGDHFKHCGPEIDYCLKLCGSQIERAFERFGGLRVEEDGTVLSTHGELPGWLRLTRKCQTLASQRAMFMEAMSETFRGFLGAPCDEAVRALAIVAFKVDTTVDAVRNASRRR
jgi:hypothetical protein